MEQNGRPIRIWPMLGVVDWWWLLVAGSLEFWAAEALHVPGWVPSLSGLWIILQAAWLKRAEPSSKAIYAFLASLASIFAFGIPAASKLHGPAFFWLNILWVATWITGVFLLRAEMCRHVNRVDPRGLRLNGFMSFFFSSLYFQYWFRELYKEQTEPGLSLTPSQG